MPLSFLFLASVQAAPLGVGEGETPFEVLKWDFENGQNVSYEEVEGFYSGRCYGMGRPNKAFAGAIGIYESDQYSDHGPKFSELDRRIFVVPAGDDTRPGFFDNVGAWLLRSGMDKYPGKYTNLEDYRGTIASRFIFKGKENILWPVKKSGNFLISVGIALKSYNALPPDQRKVSLRFEEGDILMACYFFKKLK